MGVLRGQRELAKTFDIWEQANTYVPIFFSPSDASLGSPNFAGVELNHAGRVSDRVHPQLRRWMKIDHSYIHGHLTLSDLHFCSQRRLH